MWNVKTIYTLQWCRVTRFCFICKPWRCRHWTHYQQSLNPSSDACKEMKGRFFYFDAAGMCNNVSSSTGPSPTIASIKWVSPGACSTHGGIVTTSSAVAEPCRFAKTLFAYGWSPSSNKYLKPQNPQNNEYSRTTKLYTSAIDGKERNMPRILEQDSGWDRHYLGLL